MLKHISQKPDVIELYEIASLEYIELRDDPVKTLKEAINIDPENPILHLCISNLYLLSTNFPPDEPMLNDPIKISIQLLKKAKNEYGQRLLKASQALRTGDFSKGCDQFIILMKFDPSDKMILRFITDCVVKSGEIQKLRETKRIIKKYYQQNTKYWNHYQSFYSFCCEEEQKYSKAELLAQLAYEFNPRNIWAIHSLAHIYEMTNQTEKGAYLLNNTEKIWVKSFLKTHIAWHYTLFLLEQNLFTKSLNYYERFIINDDEVTANNLVDATGYLWRAMLKGQFHKEKFLALGNLYLQKKGLLYSGLFIIHCMMNLSVVGLLEEDFLKAEIYLQDLNTYFQKTQKLFEEKQAIIKVKQNKLTNFKNYKNKKWVKLEEPVDIDNLDSDFSFEINVHGINKILLKLSQGILLYIQGNYNKSDELIEPILLENKKDYIKLGGSTAQRQILSLTLIDSKQKQKMNKLIVEDYIKTLITKKQQDLSK